MNIYVASSWRNDFQPHVVESLKSDGHDVYDFRNPSNGDHGFSWKEIDPAWEQWDNTQYLNALQFPEAERGFQLDRKALINADATLLVLPCGKSAHLELGFAIGRRQRTVILLEPGKRPIPELMYKFVDCMTDSLVTALEYLR